MSKYKRFYPNKASTLFRNYIGFQNGIDGVINTSQNPIMELRDGASQSYLIFEFTIEDVINSLSLSDLVNSANLRLFDGGSLMLPSLPLKYIDLWITTEEWVEGDGFGFTESEAKVGVANWNKRNSNDNWNGSWENHSFSQSQIYHLNKANEDLNLDCLDWIKDCVDNGVATFTLVVKLTERVNSTTLFRLSNGQSGDEVTIVEIDGENILTAPIPFTNLAATSNLIIQQLNLVGYTATLVGQDIQVEDTRSVDASSLNGLFITGSGTNSIAFTVGIFEGGINGFEQDDVIKTKYIFSHHTRTVFKPYLEIDWGYSYNDLKFVSTPIINQSYLNVLDQPSGLSITLSQLDGTSIPLIVNSIQYLEQDFATALFSFASGYEGETLILTWLDAQSNVLVKRLIKVEGSVQLTDSFLNIANYSFYCTKGANSNSIVKGNIIRYNVICEKKFGTKFLSNNFEYRVIMSNGFEMQGWKTIDITNGEMWFDLDTSFYFPSIQYIVCLRYRKGNSIINSPSTDKFTIAKNELLQTEDFSASPYNSRDFFLR